MLLTPARVQNRPKDCAIDMASNKNDTKGIIDGFDEDFIEIIDRFRSKADSGIADFFDIWDELSLDYIFANRYDPRELIDAISEINKRLVLTLVGLKTQDPHHRIVAIYFLLCLYAKQPSNMKQKIRMTCDDATSVQEFCSQTCGPQLGKDVRFAWRYMLENGAIDLVEQRAILGPSMLSFKGLKKDQLNDANTTEKLLGDRQESLDFIENKLEPHLEQLENLSANYAYIKSALAIDKAPGLSSSDKNITEIVTDAKSTVDGYKSSISNM